MTNRFQDLRRNVVIRNVVSLSGIQALNYIFPIVLIPFLARVLGVDTWGAVAIAQGVANFGILLIEYGFNLSATRAASRLRKRTDQLAELIAGVIGAKVALSALVILLAICVQRYTTYFRADSWIWWSALFWAIPRGLSFTWFFQAMEDMGKLARIEITTRLLATVAMFAVVRDASDAWLVLGLQGLAAWVSLLIQGLLVTSTARIQLPTRRHMAKAFKEGSSMFVFRSATSLYTSLNIVVLGFYASPTGVGLFTGAERIVRATAHLMTPLSQAVYPRVSHLVERDTRAAARLVQKSFITMLLIGGTTSVALLVLAPQIIRILLGYEFLNAVRVLRVLALLPMLIGMSNVWGIQWMLPLGLDRIFNKVILLGGVINLVLAFVLAPRLQEMGMAWSVLVTEIFVTLSFYSILRVMKIHPSGVAASDSTSAVSKTTPKASAP